MYNLWLARIPWYTRDMKYVALLRGINVGGNSLIKMADLKAVFEKHGYTNVVTYINSGNVIFETNEKKHDMISEHLEKVLSAAFKIPLTVVVRSHDQLKDVFSDAPAEWKRENDIRCYVTFIREPVTAKDASKEVSLRENIDEMKVGKGHLYFSTKLSGITKSHINKVIGKPIYKSMTMRNFNTVQKILALMEETK